MAHLDEPLPACAAYAFQIGPEFQTLITTRRNRRERRNAELSQVLHRATLPVQNVSEVIYRALKRHFLVCRGRLHTFPLTDPVDHEAVDEPFGVGDGVTLVFQLRKVSTVDGVDYEREIYLPRGAVIEDNGSPASPTVGAETGEVTFAVAPAVGHVLTWSGEFDLKVRFDNDYLPFSIDNHGRDGYLMNGSIDLVEVPE